MTELAKRERESVRVLKECIELQLKKSQDYQNPNSNVKQAMHYRRGVSSIYDTMVGKMYRIQSVIETMENDPNHNPNFESLEDSFKDLINYASFAVSYLRYKMDGQDTTRDVFNRNLNKQSKTDAKEFLLESSIFSNTIISNPAPFTTMNSVQSYVSESTVNLPSSPKPFNLAEDH